MKQTFREISAKIFRVLRISINARYENVDEETETDTSKHLYIKSKRASRGHR